MLWSGLALKYFDSVQTDQHEAERSNQNFTMVFEENVLRSIGEIDKALLYLRRISKRGENRRILHRRRHDDVLSELIVQVAIVDALGIIRASNAITQSSAPISVGDREHFQVMSTAQKTSYSSANRSLAAPAPVVCAVHAKAC